MSFATSSSHQDTAVSVKRSRIDGFGVFADEAVPLGAKLGGLTGEAISVAEARRRAQGRQRIMLVELSASRAIDATRSTDAMRFTNHSCAPNARIQVEGGVIEFFALRDLVIGDEITVDYGVTHHEGRLACRCAQPGCSGWL